MGSQYIFVLCRSLILVQLKFMEHKISLLLIDDDEKLPDIVIVDIMLPEIDGFEVCKRIRKESNVPILMLTARGDVADRIVGLELGADDYLPKPFEPRELVARIRAVLRRAGGQAPRAPGPELRFAGWTFHRVHRQLKAADGLVVPLSAAEFRLLSALVDRPGQALSRERLLEITRAPGVQASERSIDLAVSLLRSKLGDEDALLIRTLRGAGYLFAAKVNT